MLEMYACRLDGTRIAQIDEYGSFAATLSWEDISSWVLDLDVSVWRRSGLDDTTRLEVRRDGAPLISGPVTSIDRTMTDQENSVTIAGSDDRIWLKGRLAMPKPSQPWTAEDQGTVEAGLITYDSQVGAAETIIHHYVDVNAGPSARPGRRVPGLVMGINYGRGDILAGSARFQPVMEIIRDIALASGEDIGFSILPNDEGALEFKVLVSTDRGLVLSEDRGNLAGFHIERSRANATATLVGGAASVEGSPRLLYERLNPAGIARSGRWESFIDQSSGASLAELDQAAIRELTDNHSISATISSVTGVRFGVDWGLGDIITIVVDGEASKAAVREVRYSTTSDGETAVPTIGPPGTTGDPSIFTLVRRIEREVTKVQRLR